MIYPNDSNNQKTIEALKEADLDILVLGGARVISNEVNKMDYPGFEYSQIRNNKCTSRLATRYSRIPSFSLIFSAGYSPWMYIALSHR